MSDLVVDIRQLFLQGPQLAQLVGAFGFLVDWSELPRDGQWQLLWASIPRQGRALTLYEEVHPQRDLNNRAVHDRFLQAFAGRVAGDVLPDHAHGRGISYALVPIG